MTEITAEYLMTSGSLERGKGKVVRLVPCDPALRSARSGARDRATRKTAFAPPPGSSPPLDRLCETALKMATRLHPELWADFPRLVPLVALMARAAAGNGATARTCKLAASLVVQGEGLKRKVVFRG